MKKKLLFVAVTVLALASCSSDETVAVKQESPISFRSLTNNVTRAADITDASDLKSFNVFAQLHSDGSDYIGVCNTGGSAPVTSVTFTGPGTYNSASKYYWPSTGTLDFYAWSANSDANGNKESNVTVTDYKTYVVTVPKNAPGDPKDATMQPDFIYASNYNQAKPISSPATVALTFNHYESRIVLKVKNTANNLSFEVSGWKIVYPDESGTISFSNFDGSATSYPVPTAVWSNNTGSNVDNEFVSVFTPITKAENTAATQLGIDEKQMIMIPQEVVGDNPGNLEYLAGTDPTTKLNRAYIAIKYEATNTTDHSTPAADGWRCWPLPASTTWEQGKQYTYVIDIADGGYKEDGTPGDPAEPEFAGSLIQFASITVTPWITDLNNDSDTTNDDIPLSGN